MTTTLDERILIPTTPTVVWEHLSDLAKNPTWQVDCANISFLTTFQRGAGVRYRYRSAGKRDYVVEVKTWYDRIGYEYVLVDGAPFRDNKGRIRLQEIAEGTIVQWTFTYEMGGALGGLRDSLGTKRQLESTMVSSLKKLWLYLKQRGANTGPVLHEAKSLMREAPDVEARAQYKPRHPSALEQTEDELEAQPSLLAEPPVAEDDTRPRVAIKVDAPVVEEPDFLSDFQPTREVPRLEPEIAAEAYAEDDLPFPNVPLASAPATEPKNQWEKPVEQVEASPERTPLMTTPAIPDALAAKATTSTHEEPVDVSKMDTAQISVFELFGLQKPSETQEMRSLGSVDPRPKITDEVIEYTPIEIKRRGWRIVSRRHQVKIRRF